MHASEETVYTLFYFLCICFFSPQDLVVRLLFTLGNLTAKSIEARERVYEEDGGIDVLLDVFQVYQTTPSEQHPAPEREDVLIKLIRLLANLAIHPTVGTALAANPLCVQLLLQVLGTKHKHNSFHFLSDQILLQVNYQRVYRAYVTTAEPIMRRRYR